jgi:excisionase family DNA binding protein
MFPQRTRTEIVGDLLATAIEDAARGLPSFKGEYIARDERGVDVYSATGKAADFRNIANKHYRELEIELGNPNPGKVYEGELFMDGDEEEIAMGTLTLPQAAQYLHLHPITLLRKVHAGVVPAAKPGKCWVFLLPDLDAFLRSLYRQREQAPQGTQDEEESSWANLTGVTTHRIGGSKSPAVSVESQYLKVLGLPITNGHVSTSLKGKLKSGSKIG